MLKNLYISYSKILLDPSNIDTVLGYRSSSSSIIFNPSLLKIRLNLIFRYLIWNFKNSGHVLFLVEASDARLFSRFIFFCNLLPACRVQTTENLSTLKKNLTSENTVVVTLFVNPSLLHFIQQESRRANFPIISFSYIDSNSYGNALSVVSSDTFDSKTVIYNLLILLLAKIL